MDIKISKKLDIYKAVKDALSGGHILAVYGECDRIYAENALSDIVREYRVSKKVFPSKTECTDKVVSELMNIGEDVRLILVFGGDALIDATRIAATMLGIGYVIVQTTAMRLVEGSAYVFNENRLEIRQVIEPKAHLVDSTLISRKGNIEYFIGDVAEMLLAAYDRLFAETVSSGSMGDSSTIHNIIDKMSTFSEGNVEGIMTSAYTLSLSSPHILSRICHEIAYHDAKGNNMHMYKFGMAYMILMLYKAYIKYDGDDLLYPPDIVESARILSRRYGLDISQLVLGYKVMGSNEYMRMTHIAGEYRTELMDMLDKCITAMKRAARVYRRVSRDAGYRLYEDIRLEDLCRAVSVFAIYESLSTPLRIMKTGGFLEKYVAI